MKVDGKISERVFFSEVRLLVASLQFVLRLGHATACRLRSARLTLTFTGFRSVAKGGELSISLYYKHPQRVSSVSFMTLRYYPLVRFLHLSAKDCCWRSMQILLLIKDRWRCFYLLAKSYGTCIFWIFYDGLLLF